MSPPIEVGSGRFLGTIVLRGRVPSKKNSRINTVVKGKMRSFPSRAYSRYLKKQLDEIRNQQDFKTIRRPVMVEVLVYDHQEKWRKDPKLTPSGTDIDNKLNSIFDLFTKAGIWVDDSVVDTVIATKFPGEKLNGDFGAVVSIYEIE